MLWSKREVGLQARKILEGAFKNLIKLVFFLTFTAGLVFSSLAIAESEKIVVGGKKFTENYILAELIAQLLESHGFEVERKLGMDGLVVYKALLSGEVQIYPEYTGTIIRSHLKLEDDLTVVELNEKLKLQNLEVLPPLGFNNTYAITVRKETFEKEGIQKISDLRGTDQRGVLTFEFVERNDGWAGLTKVYNLKNRVTGMEHGLTYEALTSKAADFLDAYSTDAKIRKFNLRALEDDKEFFPKYFGLLYFNQKLPQKARDVLRVLSGRIDDEKMIEMNAEAEYGGKSFAQVARQFLVDEELISENSKSEVKGLFADLLRQTWRHLLLTFSAVFLATLLAVPGGIVLSRNKSLAKPVLFAAGLMQTIPSIALLAFMIPIFGIGVKPAIVALILFSILPIIRNTVAALESIDPVTLDAAKGIGLNSREVLFIVQLPLAFPIILTGIRTAAVINVGTATLAAFVGAGGLGESIVTGLALNSNQIILQGALPAAALAVLLELGFDFLQKKVNYA